MKNFQKRLLLVLIYLSLFSPGLTFGGFWDEICGYCGFNPFCWITCPLQYGFTLIFRIPIFIFALIGVAIAGLAILLGWLIVPPIVDTLIKISLDVGIYSFFENTWASIKDFALSLVRIFILIVGIMTIFRVREYEARKTLVSVLVAALLVSFSLVIGKQIIQWGNEFTKFVGNFFGLGGPGGYVLNVAQVYGNLANALFAHFGENVWKIFTADGEISRFFTKTLWIIMLIAISYWVFAFVSIYISFVLIALGIVFLLRLIYLVCLLIVSPIAFLTAGLRTKEIRQIFGGFLNWEGWWPKFLEWVFIGIVLLIWLGVGLKILDVLRAQNITIGNIDCGGAFSQQDPEVTQRCNEEMNFIAQQLVAFVPVFAFALAVHLGVKTSPGIVSQVVEGVIGAAKLVTTAVVTAGVAAVTAGVGAAGAAAAAGASRLGAIGAGLRAGAIEGGRAFVGSLGKGVPGELKRVEVLKPGVEMVEEVAKPITPWIKRPLIVEREEAEKEVEKIYKEKGAKGLEEIVKSSLYSDVVRAAALAKLLKEGRLSDELMESKEFQDFLKTKEGSKYLKDVLKLRVDLAPQFVNPKTGRPFTPQEILKEISPKEAVKIRVKALLDPEVVSAMNPEQARAIVRGGSMAQKEAIGKSYAEIIRRQANVILDTTTPERLRDSVIGAFPAIQNTINILRRSPHPEDVSRAETLREIGNAILDRRLTWY
jgi:hypothetical protein